MSTRVVLQHKALNIASQKLKTHRTAFRVAGVGLQALNKDDRLEAIDRVHEAAIQSDWIIVGLHGNQAIALSFVVNLQRENLTLRGTQSRTVGWQRVASGQSMQVALCTFQYMGAGTLGQRQPW